MIEFQSDRLLTMRGEASRYFPSRRARRRRDCRRASVRRPSAGKSSSNPRRPNPRAEHAKPAEQSTSSDQCSLKQGSAALRRGADPRDGFNSFKSESDRRCFRSGGVLHFRRRTEKSQFRAPLQAMPRGEDGSSTTDLAGVAIAGSWSAKSCRTPSRRRWHSVGPPRCWFADGVSARRFPDSSRTSGAAVVWHAGFPVEFECPWRPVLAPSQGHLDGSIVHETESSEELTDEAMKTDRSARPAVQKLGDVRGRRMPA